MANLIYVPVMSNKQRISYQGLAHIFLASTQSFRNFGEILIFFRDFTDFWSPMP